MKLDCEQLSALATPAYVFRPVVMEYQLRLLRSQQQSGEPRLVFPLKAMSIPHILQEISDKVDGYAVSSLFEARLARDIVGVGGTVHMTSPGLRADEFNELSKLCDHICFNSLNQLQRYCHQVESDNALGLRVNTELSFAKDKRYDPSNLPSKLGAPISAVRRIIEGDCDRLKAVKGILIHSNCESEDFTELLSVVEHVEREVPWLLKHIDWINLGGGYLFDEESDWKPFRKAVSLLTEQYGLEVFFEPGSGIVAEACCVLSSVLDIFDSGDKKIAILDTTANHMPEVFEYQYKPPVTQHSDEGEHGYLLAGATCLAGDLFGEYRFDQPLKVGSRLVFEDMGAYTLVKSHTFNGINLPSIYVINADGNIELIREYDYHDFLSRSGVNRDVTLREIPLSSKTD